MKFYSEVLNKMYDSVEECNEAERMAKEKEEQARLEKEKLIALEKARKVELDKAYEELQLAQDKYNKLLKDWFKDHRTYRHISETKNKDNENEIDLEDLIDTMMRSWGVTK